MGLFPAPLSGPEVWPGVAVCEKYGGYLDWARILVHTCGRSPEPLPLHWNPGMRRERGEPGS